MNDNSSSENIKNNTAILPSTKVKSRKKGITAYAENPFWKPFDVDIGKKRVTIAGGLIQKTDSGETTHVAGIHRVEEVDEDQFVKLYTKNLRIFFDLTPASQKLLECVISLVQKQPRCLGIYIEWRDMFEYAEAHNLKYSRTSFHRALHEMIEKGFIAESERSNFFWINLHLFFNGDRMVLITEYRKKNRVAIPKDVQKREALEARGQMRIDGNTP